MSVYELMAKLGAAGIKLWVDDGQLKFKAPKGALTPDLKAELVENKAAVIEFLVQPTVIQIRNPVAYPRRTGASLWCFPTLNSGFNCVL